MGASPLAEVLLLLARLLVGAVFFLAGHAKVRPQSSKFVEAVLGYGLLPRSIATAFARCLPPIEMVLGAFLAIGLWSRCAAVVGFSLLMLFSSAMIISILRGNKPSCGCFGSLTQVQWRLVYRNLSMMGILLPIYYMDGGSYTVQKWLGLQGDASLLYPATQAFWGGGWFMAVFAILVLRLYSSVNEEPLAKKGQDANG